MSLKPGLLAAADFVEDWPGLGPGVLRLAKAIRTRAAECGDGWIALSPEHIAGNPPFDGQPVLILTNHTWTSRIHRAVWTDEINGNGIFGWAVEDCKHGPYPLRGYSIVTHWQPLPAPPNGSAT